MARGSDRRVLSAVTIYNEIEPYAADWLENLIAAGHIAPGTVDRRSIAEITPDDLKQATQFHTFAGIGLWSYALRLAGWPAHVPVWTGSCPCQPWSSASRGRAQGQDDPRHLWPVWFRLIRECVPPIVFGEQVAGGGGLDWAGRVADDFESAGYAFGAAVMCASAFGFPPRPRLFFVAHANSKGKRACSINVKMASLCAPSAMGRSDTIQRLSLGAAGDGYPARVARLRAIGNAIVPQVAAAFIRSAAEAVGLACEVN